MNVAVRWFSALGLVLTLYAAQGFAAAESAGAVGQTTFVFGTVQARGPAGETRTLPRGAAVYAGDTLITGADGIAQLRFIDDSRMVLRRSTEVAIAQFKFSVAATAPDERFLVRLTSGALRSITGLIGRRNK